MRWVHKSSLATLEWMPADIELVNMLVRMGEEDEQALVKRRAAVRKSMQGNKRRDTKPELEWMPADIELVNMLVRMGEEDEQALVKRRAAVRKSMQGNKRRDTKPELLVRQRLRAAGLTGYRLDWAKAPGRPDIAFPGRKIAIFVNGCYWHRCPHCNPSMPSKNVEFWEAKFRRW